MAHGVSGDEVRGCGRRRRRPWCGDPGGRAAMAEQGTRTEYEYDDGHRDEVAPSNLIHGSQGGARTQAGLDTGRVGSAGEKMARCRQRRMVGGTSWRGCRARDRTGRSSDTTSKQPRATVSMGKLVCDTYTFGCRRTAQGGRGRSDRHVSVEHAADREMRVNYRHRDGSCLTIRNCGARP